MEKKIVVGLSGGIDSGISLVLLKKQGWSPIGVSLKIPVWNSSKAHPKNYLLAKKVCRKLKVPFYFINASDEFQKKVVDYFIRQYQQGQTPNPCLICNRELKFEKLFSFAEKHHINYVATGHYAKINNNKLLTAKDKNKDQTYNLAFLPKKWLKYLVFPLGNYTKKEVYLLAKKKGLGFLTRAKQSQNFCYLANTSIQDFLTKKLGHKQGKIVDEQGKILGKHKGLHFYTLGQRKGILINNGPYFVKYCDFKNNQLVVTKNPKTVVQKEVFLAPFNFLIPTPKKPIKILAKVRYRQAATPAILYPVKNRLKIVFKKPQKAVTPGQWCVFYQKNICLGGGKILPF